MNKNSKQIIVSKYTYIYIDTEIRKIGTCNSRFFLEGLKSLPDKIMLRIFGVEAAHFQL